MLFLFFNNSEVYASELFEEIKKYVSSLMVVMSAWRINKCMAIITKNHSQNVKIYQSNDLE